ncbi:MAG: sensor histidine kinase, partial [Phycisphaerae bacterium]
MTARTHTAARASGKNRRSDPPASAVAADAVLEALDGAVLVVDPEGRINRRNARAATWLPEGKDLDTLLAGAGVFESFDGWTAALSGVVETGKPLLLDGAIRPRDATAPVVVTFRCTRLVEPGASRRPGVVVLITQRPAQAAVEQRQEVSQRLASLGKLAARVAHELNNPLDGILRYNNLALRMVDRPDSSKLKSYLAESRTGLLRMVHIIGDLLEYSRATDGAFDAVGVNDLIDQVIRSAAGAADANGVVVTADYQTPDMPAACGTRLYQICGNLIHNAIDAMPGGGRLSITAAMVDATVVIRVADTGEGLPDPPERVFEPFFTTKAPGKGTGLGLAICK